MWGENGKTWLLSAIASLAILSALYLVRAANSQAEGPTFVSGIISTPTTWTASGSPYIVTGNILVTRTVTLTVEPGVAVKFDGPFYLRVDGALKAIGTPSQPITFTSNRASPERGDWDSIRFSEGSVSATYDALGNYVDGSSLQHVTVEYGGSGDPYDGATIRGRGEAAPFITRSTIARGAGSAIALEAGMALVLDNVVEDNDFRSNAFPGSIYVGGPARIVSNTVRGNIGYAAVSVGTGPAFVAQNAVVSNTVVAAISFARGAGTALSNVISGNLGTGIQVDGSSVAIVGNTIWGNRPTHGGGIYVGRTSQILPGSFARVSNNLITGNRVDGSAGGVLVERGSEAVLEGNTIWGNTAGSLGGAVYASGAVTLTLNDIRDNLAASGGGLYIAVAVGPISFNNIVGNTPTAIHNAASTPVTAPNNYWGTTDTSAIDAAIYDFYDDFDKGIVSYAPMLTQPISLPLRSIFFPLLLRNRPSGW